MPINRLILSSTLQKWRCVCRVSLDEHLALVLDRFQIELIPRFLSFDVKCSTGLQWDNSLDYIFSAINFCQGNLNWNNSIFIKYPSIYFSEHLRNTLYEYSYIFHAFFFTFFVLLIVYRHNYNTSIMCTANTHTEFHCECWDYHHIIYIYC